MVNKFGTIVLLAILTSHAVTTFASKQTSLQPPSQLATTKNPEPIVLNVTVTGKNGGFVTGLEPNAFEVSIDKKPAQIVSLSDADSPASVGILLDSSGSMTGGSQKKATKNFSVVRDALQHFLDSSNKSNDYFLMGFNEKTELLADWTSDTGTIIDKFNGFYIYGDTALYDACYVAVDKLQGGQHAKRALILISDGLDSFSRYSFNELRDSLRGTNVVLYSIYFPNGRLGGTIGMPSSGVLEKLSSLSGGKFLSNEDGAPLKLKNVNAAFEIIATELRNQYTLCIIPNEPLASKKWHKIKVKVNLPPNVKNQVKGLEIRTREGVYAR